MGLRDRLRRLEEQSEGLYMALTLPDGTTVRYTGEEMVGATLAAIDQEEHPLLPYLRQMNTREGMPGLIRALEGSEADGA